MSISKFDNSPEAVFIYLKENFFKYKTFKQFILKDKRGSNISSLTYRYPRIKKIVYYFWKKRISYTRADCLKKLIYVKLEVK